MIHPKRCEITQISKLFIARVSMPMHTERDIVMANLSVCPSHCDLYRNECNRQTVSTIWNEAFFLALPPLQNSKWTHSALKRMLTMYCHCV